MRKSFSKTVPMVFEDEKHILWNSYKIPSTTIETSSRDVKYIVLLSLWLEENSIIYTILLYDYKSSLEQIKKDLVLEG